MCVEKYNQTGKSGGLEWFDVNRWIIVHDQRKYHYCQLQDRGSYDIENGRDLDTVNNNKNNNFNENYGNWV